MTKTDKMSTYYLKYIFTYVLSRHSQMCMWSEFSHLHILFRLHILWINNTYYVLFDSSEIWDVSRYSKFMRNLNINR